MCAFSCAIHANPLLVIFHQFSLVTRSSRTVPAEGIEPTRSCDHWILSPARLPVPPRRREEIKLQKRSGSSSVSRWLRRSVLVRSFRKQNSTIEHCVAVQKFRTKQSTYAPRRKNAK